MKIELIDGVWISLIFVAFLENLNINKPFWPNPDVEVEPKNIYSSTTTEMTTLSNSKKV